VTIQHSEIPAGHGRVDARVAQRAGLHGESFVEHGLGFLMLSSPAQHSPEIIEGRECVLVLRAELPTPDAERLPKRLLGPGQVVHAVANDRQVVQRRHGHWVIRPQ
jgi:hypothetical protein